MSVGRLIPTDDLAAFDSFLGVGLDFFAFAEITTGFDNHSTTCRPSLRRPFLTLSQFKYEPRYQQPDNTSDTLPVA